MSDDEKPENGTSEGPHARDPERRSPTEAGRQAIAADLDRIDQARSAADGEQLDLLAGSLDLEDQDALATAAELIARPRRERGRPPGSTNKRNTQVFDYLERLGHRDPAVTLSMIQSADTIALAKALGADSFKGRIAVLSLQRSAAAELMPYKYAKKPQQLELPADAKRPLMVIGEMNVINRQQNEYMSVGDPRAEKANEINGRAVRPDKDKSHDDSQAIDVADENDDQAPD